MLCSSCVLCLVSSSLLSSSALRHPLHPISNLQFQISNVRSSSSRRRPNRPSTSKPSSPSSHRGRRSRNGFPTKNRIWIGSTNPGNQKSQTASGPAKALKERWRPANECRTMMNPVPTGSTNARLGKPRSSRLAMAAYSSWNTPDIEGTHTSRIRRPRIFQKILGNADRKAIFALEEFDHDSDKTPHFPAVSRRTNALDGSEDPVYAPFQSPFPPQPLFPSHPVWSPDLSTAFTSKANSLAPASQSAIS